MSKFQPTLRILLCLLTLCLGQVTFGWGSYGHEQINRAAARAIENHPFGKWLGKNLKTVQRLAVTPDYDWKHVGLAPDDEELDALRSQADRYEHPLHYFEPDAFLPKGIVDLTTAKLLAIDAYSLVFPSYKKMRVENEEYVVSIDPDKALADIANPTAKEITAHGTAPWRVAQLWQLGVDALKKKDFEHGLAYLGAMGHYVGDSAQPFHGSLDYDGKAHEPTAGGIHAAYETKVFEHLAKGIDDSWDKVEKVWLNFDATEDDVVKATLKKMEKVADVTPATTTAIVGRVMNLVIAAHRYIQPLEDVFAEAILEENGDAASIRVATVTAFMQKKIGNADLKIPTLTIEETAKDQLSDGAAVLAKLWMAAYDAAKEEPSFDISEAPKVNFTEELVLRNYPKPSYLPQGGGGHTPPAPAFGKRETGDAHHQPKPDPRE